MKAYFDTSVLVAALLRDHPRHAESAAWLDRVHRHEVKGCVSLHGLVETWSVLTGMPLHPPLAAADVHRLLQEAVLRRFDVVGGSRADYGSTLARAAARDIRGGAVFDALHAAAARRAHARVLLTLDPGDFRRVAPDLARRIREP